MGKNAYLCAKQAADNGNWKEVYDICVSYLDDTDYDTWDSLEGDEEVEIRILRIQCLIYGIRLEKLYSGKMEGHLLLCTEDYASVIEMIEETMDGTLVYLIGDDETGYDEAQDKRNIETMFDRVAKIAQDHYYFFLDKHINAITMDSRDDSWKAFVDYQLGYNCLWQYIFHNYALMDSYLEELSLKNDASSWQEAQRVTCDKLFAKAMEISNAIDGMSDDFPYFCDQLASYMYLRATGVLNASVPNDKWALDKSERIERLKCDVNLRCDYLNAIYVINGQRVSLCPTQKVRDLVYSELMKSVEAIRVYEPGYRHPEVRRELFFTMNTNTAKNGGGNGAGGGGCYVATAVYGSYDCPEVWTLRRYRDDTLAQTWYGRAFIRTYYAVSPTLVKWFGHTKWFKKMWHGKLDRMVAKLQANGVESTPYKDKHW